jgi:hypothetical protein
VTTAKRQPGVTPAIGINQVTQQNADQCAGRTAKQPAKGAADQFPDPVHQVLIVAVVRFISDDFPAAAEYEARCYSRIS